jgi:hypothetical protein
MDTPARHYAFPERCDAGVACELGVALEAFDRADLAEQLRGAERATTGECEQARCELACVSLELVVKLEDRARETAAAADELRFQGEVSMRGLPSEPRTVLRLRPPLAPVPMLKTAA